MYKYKIAISGKANSGKNTVATLLCKSIIEHNEYSGKWGAHIAFADPIKEIIMKMFPQVQREYLYGSSKFRDSIIPGAFKNGKPLTYRQALIDMGALGRSYNENVWIEAFEDSYNKILKDDNHDTVVVTDVRYRNELTRLEKLGFTKIRLLRNSINLIDDSSETNQDSIKNEEFDHILLNNSSIEDLKVAVNKIVATLNVK